MASFELIDLIDIKTLQEIQDGFSAVTGMAALTVDADGNALTKGSNFTDFCMKYTRKSSVGCKRCEKCDSDGAEKTAKSGRAVTYDCHAGLMDFAAPIVINGEKIGAFIGGQVLTEKPDEAKFRRIAKELGVNPDEYIAALKKVKIISKDEVRKAADFLYTIAKTISSMAYGHYLTKRHNQQLAGNIDASDALINEIVNIANSSIRAINEMDEKFNSLAQEANNCVNEVKTTNETVKIIQDIAMNTRILGFNASIEASRAKESGKGFGVIAQEVRSLADTSKNSADKIQSKMKTISGYVAHIDEEAVEAKEIVRRSLEDVERLKTVIQSIK